MKKVFSLSLVLLSMMVCTVYSQEKSKSETKENRKLEQQKQVTDLINGKEFVFVAQTAYPTGSKSVSLSGNPNFVKFHPEMIEGSMPFFGRAYGSIGYGSDPGLKFSNKPEEFTVAEKKKNYQVNASVRNGNDLYKLSMTVSFDGSANLSVISPNRSTISYQGGISPVVKPEEKK